MQLRGMMKAWLVAGVWSALAIAASDGEAKEDAPSLKGLPGVELEGLDPSQEKWLMELLQEYPSLCGKAHSLYTSLRSDPACKRSPFGSRYLSKMLKSGLMKSESEELYEKRFVKPELGKCETAGAPVRGAATAHVTICEFSDFQCPHCKLMEPILTRLLDDEKGKVKLYYKNYPIEKLHPNAGDAAAAAVAAGWQGKFWEMHDLLFAHQEQLSPSEIEGYAAQLKLDVKKWKGDLDAARVQVAKERAEGEKSDVAATPTLYINGRKYSGPHRYEEIKDWIDEELVK